MTWALTCPETVRQTLLLLFGRIASIRCGLLLQMYLDLCACLLVTKVSPAKTDELIEMLFGYDKGDQNSSDFKYGTAAEMLKNGLLLASCCRLKSRQQQRKLCCRW